MSAKQFQLEMAISRFLFAVIVMGIAGVALCPTRLDAATRDASTPAPRADTNARPSQPAGAPPTAQTTRGTGVFINQREITQQQWAAIKHLYGAAPPGHYWYDARSGLYGKVGFEAAGYIHPGLDFGPLAPDASNGNTGIFINGREINMTEAMFFQRIVGGIFQGRWWLDGETGNVGMEGMPIPMANLATALQQAQFDRSGYGGYRWRNNIHNLRDGHDNGCAWVNIPGGSYPGGGC
jgi:hypothetical protein